MTTPPSFEPDGALPVVSVVMPARNEGATIREAVLSALSQQYGGELEVIVADGASDDGTRQMLVDLQAGHPRLHVVDNPDRITPAGLNRAIEAARGDVIVRLDGHAVLPPGYVRRAVETLEATGADNVGGIQEARGTTLLQRGIALGMSIPMGVGDAKFRYGGEPGPVDTVYLGVFRRTALDRAGLFDETMTRNQDYELNYRIRQSGGVVYFDPALRILYEPRRTLRALAKQYFRYGRGKRAMLRKHLSSLRWRQLAPPLLLVGLVASTALALTPWRRFGLIIPGLYVAAVAGATIWTLIRTREAASLLLPAVLPTMHLSWGAGLLDPTGE